MEKPPFDPNKPHEVIGQDKPVFDPSQSFQNVSEQEAPSALGALVHGGLQGLTGGFMDELGAGVASGLQTIEDTVKDKIPEKESKLEHLISQYKKYKKVAEDDEAGYKKEHPYLYGGAELAGSFLPVGEAFKAVHGASLGTKIATGAGLGAASEYGHLGQDEKNQEDKVLKSAALGGIGTGIGETVISPLIDKGINKASAYLQDQPWANQLAATVQNKLEGGTLFGSAGRQAVAAKTKQLSTDVGDALTGNVESKIDNMGNAFKQSANEFIDSTKSEYSQPINDAKAAISSISKGALSKQFEKLRSGAATPSDANDIRTAIKGFISDLYDDKNPLTSLKSKETIEQLNNSGIIPALEKMTEGTSAPISALNTEISNARSPLDAFVQKTGSIVSNPEDQYKYSSALPIEKQGALVQQTLQNMMKRSGRSTELGAANANSLADLQNLLTKAKQVSPSLNLDPEEIARKLQTQGFLNAADQSVAGIREQKLQLETPSSWISNLGASPFKLAESAVSGPLSLIPGVKGTVSEMSKRLLKPSPAERQAVSQALYNNPATKHLATQYEQALISKVPGKLNNIIFQMMQNPEAKKVMGINEEGQR